MFLNIRSHSSFLARRFCFGADSDQSALPATLRHYDGKESHVDVSRNSSKRALHCGSRSGKSVVVVGEGPPGGTSSAISGCGSSASISNTVPEPERPDMLQDDSFAEELVEEEASEEGQERKRRRIESERMDLSWDCYICECVGPALRKLPVMRFPDQGDL